MSGPQQTIIDIWYSKILKLKKSVGWFSPEKVKGKTSASLGLMARAWAQVGGSLIYNYQALAGQRAWSSSTESNPFWPTKLYFYKGGAAFTKRQLSAKGVSSSQHKKKWAIDHLRGGPKANNQRRLQSGN